VVSAGARRLTLTTQGRHEDAGVLLNLLAAERGAPEDMRHNVLARDLVRGLLRRARPSMGL
jgi:hypothetical protein